MNEPCARATEHVRCARGGVHAQQAKLPLHTQAMKNSVGIACTRAVHVHVILPSRQDAQPQVPWRHNVEGAGNALVPIAVPDTCSVSRKKTPGGAGTQTHTHCSRLTAHGLNSTFRTCQSPPPPSPPLPSSPPPSTRPPSPPLRPPLPGHPPICCQRVFHAPTAPHLFNSLSRTRVQNEAFRAKLNV